MPKRVSEAYKELYHYTTSVGLEGILRTQQLWATHIGYMNDAEEHVGFFIRRMPRLLEKPAKEAVAELLQTERGRRAIESVGGQEKAIEDLRRNLSESARETTVKMNEPYVVSFCSEVAHARTSPNDGLLSQWRGYGVDGGYAIVFAADKIEQMWLVEGKAFRYQFGNIGDVDYDYPDGVEKPPHEERVAWEAAVQEAFRKFIVTQDPTVFDNVHEAMSALASRYKHHGFSEEAEVRIVAMPVADEVYEIEEKLRKERGPGPAVPRKPVKFVRIIVGPHPDREKRAASVRSMLKQYGCSADVVVSDIPYLGR